MEVPKAASNSIASSAPDQRQLRLIAASAQANEARIRDILAEEQSWTSNHDRDALRQSLQKVAARGNLKLVRLLLSHRADPGANPRRDNEIPAILKAAEGGHAAVVTELLQHQANPNWRNSRTGQTALFAACNRGHDSVVKALLDGGADVHAMDKEGRTALLYLASEKRTGKWTVKTLKLLVDTGAALEEKDRIGRTPLVWAATNGNLEMVDALLSGELGKTANTSATNNRGQTALHLAADRNHKEMVKLLLERSADPSATSDGGWTALHNAAQSGHTDVVALLLDHNANVNSELSNGMTPLHWAAFNGHMDAVKLLLTRPEADLSIKDGFYRTPMLCAAEKFHRDIVQLLSPAHAADRLSPVAEAACKSFEATVVDFGEFRDGKQQLVFKHSVHELLYGWDHELNKPTIPTLTKNIKYQPTFRWIHLPANNLAWVETIVAKSFVESGHRDIESFKSLERCFDQEHCGFLAHANYMRPFTQRIASTHAHAADREDKQENPLVPLSEEPSEVSSVSTHPASDATPSKSSARNDVRPPPTKLLSRADTGSTSASPRLDRPEGKKKSKAEQIADRHPKRAKRASGPPGNPPGTKSRQNSMAPSLLQLPWESSRQAAPSGKLVLFMPFLHYETNEGRKKMSEAVNRTRWGRQDLTEEPSRDQLLIRAYLNHTPPLHPRRTLDQFFYHGIDTSIRDEDQVVYRYCKLHNEKPAKVFMVDQLWLWVINRDLVITCFPQRWDQPKQDPLNVLDGIIEETNAKTRPPVQSVYDLAMLITNRCAGFFDRHRMDDQQYQFLDMFESSIGAVTDKESKLFLRFNRASEMSGKLRQELIQGRRPALTGGQDPADELLDIGPETELLAEIKDIQDELNILLVILQSQAAILGKFEEHVTDELRASAPDPSARRVTDVFVAEVRRRSREQRRLLETHREDIMRMDRQAQSTHSSLTHLLDLKQKHSNALEARFARDQAVIAARQGQTVMVFTLVTIVFLPMSFIAAFFAINFQEWEDGRLNIPYVSSYMFSIGLGISVPLIIMAFTVTDIVDALRGFYGSVRETFFTKNGGLWRWFHRRKRPGEAIDGIDGTSTDDNDGDFVSKKLDATLSTSRAPRPSMAEEKLNAQRRKHSSYSGRSPPPRVDYNRMSPPPHDGLAIRNLGAPRKISVGSGGGISWAAARPSLERGKGRTSDDLEKGRVRGEEGLP